MSDRVRDNRRKWFSRIAWLAIVCGLLVVSYSKYIEPEWVEVTHHDVYMRGLPKDLDGIKIVQISDIHRGPRVDDSDIENTVKIVNAQHPDIVLVTGDFISRSPDNAVPCAKLLSKLKARIGCYAVLGNHDYWHGADQVVSALKEQGIVVLTNRNIQAKPGLFLIGLDDLWAGKPDAKAAWKGVPEDSAQVVLSHTPLTVPLFSDHKCFAVAGHTHGGEIKIPPIPRSMLPGLFRWRFIEGWYTEGNVNLYVNRGIGLVNPLGVRFLSRPEVAVFTLHRKG